MSFDRLIMLASLVIFGMLGMGVGVILGHVELFGWIGAGVGLVYGVIGALRFDKIVESNQKKQLHAGDPLRRSNDSPIRPRDPRFRGRRKRRR